MQEGVRIWTRGVDTRLFNPAKRCPEWRAALSIPQDVPVVLIVCRLVRRPDALWGWGIAGVSKLELSFRFWLLGYVLVFVTSNQSLHATPNFSLT